METVWAFATTAMVFALLLITASVVVSSAGSATFGTVRMTGPAVKRWSGYVLLGVGVWFILLAALPSPTIGS